VKQIKSRADSRTVCNEIISLLNRLPTLCAATGVPNIQENGDGGFHVHVIAVRREF